MLPGTLQKAELLTLPIRSRERKKNFVIICIANDIHRTLFMKINKRYAFFFI